MKKGLKPGRWLTRKDFDRICEAHVQSAIQSLLEGSEEHPFAESTKYDVLLDDGSRMAPKAVLGIAVRLALGLDVGTSHFRGGEGTPCFKIIRGAGLAIVPKGGVGDVPLDLEQSAWLEGGARRETHIRYERDPKAVRKKKQAFRDEHEGRLGCEECGCFPAEVYGRASGEACIEVHHTVPLAELGRRKTTLKDLKCVCANCHRILHRELRDQDRREAT